MFFLRKIFGKTTDEDNRLSHQVETLHETPLLDAVWYRSNNVDLLDAPIDCARHYLEFGAQEGRDPGPFFDTKFYLANNPDVAASGINPLVHYLQYGAAEGRDPSPLFDTDWYLREYPDVAATGSNPLVHFVLHGKGEGRFPHPTLREQSQMTKGNGYRTHGYARRIKTHTTQVSRKSRPLSVVIPTYNRAEILRDTIFACVQHSGGTELELIVIDDGSADGTVDLLKTLSVDIPYLIWRSQPNSGAGKARNVGASLAKHEVVLFLGDDIQPLNDDFFATHSRLHQANPSARVGVLGKVVWPGSDDLPLNFIMRHIQGRGGEQFGYSDLAPHTFIDYRFFYTANISVKRSVVSDWEQNGFNDAFKGYGFEDTEFAYRLSQQPDSFQIYYDPTAIAQHVHVYDLLGFLRRQSSAGMAAQTFINLHPEIANVLGLQTLLGVLHTKRVGNNELTSEYLSVMEGIKSWARIIEARNDLGREAWHDDLLSAVFELAFHQGFCVAQHDSNLNFDAGYSWVLSRCIESLRRTIHHELTSHEFISGALFKLPQESQLTGS